jgi:hypothetical protein
MRVMFDVTDPDRRMHTMTKFEGKASRNDLKGLLAQDSELLRTLMRTALQEVLEAEMADAISAFHCWAIISPSLIDRSAGRL